MSLYDNVRANVDKSSGEERVEVNQRALIDKILARYASSGAVYRELLQNSNDAEATVAEIHFTTAGNDGQPSSTSSSSSSKTVQSVTYRNNGMPFRPQDWSRLKKIAEGNPDESKIGAFGVGAYSVFSVCEEPLVLSGNQALAFVWRGDALYTKTIDNKKNDPWTSFILPSRDPYNLPDMQEFGQFLCSALTFTQSLSEIRVFVDDKHRMTITKTLVQEPSPVQIQKSSSWWKQDGASTASPNGIFSLQDANSLLESFYHVQVVLDGQTAAVTARFLSATAKTKVPASMCSRMERVTKKKPPSKVTVQIFLNGQHQQQQTNKSVAGKIIESFSPPFGGGRIFIGFRTSQTTGLAAHLAAPFVPTVEREAMDLQDPTLRLFNLELLEFSGILMRLTLEHGMTALGIEYEKGAVEREKLDQELAKKEQKDTQDESEAKAETNDEPTDAPESSTASSVWGFAKFMAKGVTKKIVKVLSTVEDMVDSGGELLNPKDPRPLCAEEHQAILLMQSFCPKQSTPDPTVGAALAQGFARCLDKAPPVLTRSGVVRGDQARLPNKGMEAFCKDGVIRTIVYKNAEEYHNLIARCRTLNLNDLATKLSEDVLDEETMIRFLKWWARYSRINPSECVKRGTSIKESIRFTLDSDGNKNPLPVYDMKDILFYLDKDEIRSDTELPMPSTVWLRELQEKITLRTLTDAAFKSWFSAIPIEVWISYICEHPCMTAGQPEDEKLRVAVLVLLSQEYSRRSPSEQQVFGSFCQSLLYDKCCIPFDSDQPKPTSADCPANLYLYSAELQAFDGIGDFHKVSQSLKHVGVNEDFLLALGVRKSVAIDFLFVNLDALKWNNDPKPLVEYLRSATLTMQDKAKLKSTQYLPAANDQSRMFAPGELYLPNDEIRIFPFLRLLQWPSEDELTEKTLNGSFLVGLGMKVVPPLVPLLQHISGNLDDELRIKCLDFVSKRLSKGNVYYHDYNRLGRSERSNLKFLPAVTKLPLEGTEVKGLHSTVTCYSDPRCGVMGFPIIDPSLESSKVYGSLFQCATEPDPHALAQELVNIVATSKRMILSARSSNEQKIADRIMSCFDAMFQYLSSRSSEFNSGLMNALKDSSFIPCRVESRVEWFRPEEVFFKNTEDNQDSLTGSLFQLIDFSPFLAAAGVKQEASTADIFRLMIENPQNVFQAIKSEAKYRMLLRRIAAQPPFRRVTKEIRESPFLLAYSISQKEEGKGDTRNYELAKAEDIFIIDNSFFGRMFPVQQAPHESDLEEFYALIGSKYISKEVQKSFDVLGKAQASTPLTKALGERIHERCPLLVSPSITSRPLVSNAASIFDDKRFEIFEAADMKAVYSLGQSVRTQRTTCCSNLLRGRKNVLYVTKDFDWFDVGYAIGELILLRCQLEDAFFISSLLEAPLEQLRARGFPVDRIIKPEPIPEPLPAPTPAPAPEPASDPPAPPTADVDTADKTPQSTASSVASKPEPTSQIEQPRGGTIAELPPPPQVTNEKSSKWPKAQKDTKDGSGDDDTTKLEAFATMLKEMYPDADVDAIQKRLGNDPKLDDVRRLAEDMATNNYPRVDEQQKEPQTKRSSLKQDPIESTSSSGASKFLGSKKLGRAFNGLRASQKGNNTAMAGPPQPGSTAPDNTTPVTPEADATSHSNMERMLEQTVRKSHNVDQHGIQSQDTSIGIPEGLDRGDSCEVIPGQNLKPFVGPHQSGMSHNGIRVFSARNFSESEQFLMDHFDAVESFAVVLERLCNVYGLKLDSIAIFHDPSGGTIAFNSNRSLHFNVRFFYALHFLQGKHQTTDCYSYWFVVAAHELAHHMVSGHNKEHGFYTESYVSLYLPRALSLFARLEQPSG